MNGLGAIFDLWYIQRKGYKRGVFMVSGYCHKQRGYGQCA